MSTGFGTVLSMRSGMGVYPDVQSGLDAISNFCNVIFNGDSFRVGLGTTSTGAAISAVALGTNCVASGNSSVGLGNGVQSLFQDSVAISRGAWSDAIGAIALGGFCYAKSDYTLAAGYNAKDWNVTLPNEESVVLGYQAAVGFNTGASPKGVVIGSGARIEATAPNGTAIGQLAKVTANTIDGTAVGSGAICNGDSGLALGKDATVNVADGVALGNGAIAIAGAGFALTVPADSFIAGAPAAADNTLVIRINGVRYKIGLTAFP